MTTLKNLFLCSFSFFLPFTLSAQVPAKRTCGTMSHFERQKSLDPSLVASMEAIERQTEAFVVTHRLNNTAVPIVTIPVVFHVIYNNATQNISDAKINAQLNQLNLDYAKLNTDFSTVPTAFRTLGADTKIQFCLAQRDPSGNTTTGIIRKSTTVTSFIDDDKIKYTSTGGDNIWDRSKYLNIWVGNLGNQLLGYAQFPGGPAASDGVVLLYSTVGSMASPGTGAPYNLGRTATHEVGHWLNLRHIWGDDGGSCSGTDNVTDTPNQGGENYNCPSFPTTDACATTSPGVMFMNYMDYVDDNCMKMFTNGQGLRMQALFSTGGSRASLLTSNGCQPITAGSFQFNALTPASIVCGTASTSLNLSTTADAGFTTPIQLAATNNPTGTTISFANTPLTPGSSTTINISNTAQLSPGTYSFTVTGTAGAVIQNITANFTVSPGNLPVITLQPEDITTTTGSSVSFTTSSTTNGISYQWMDSTSSHNWQSITGASNYSYTISNVTNDMQGNKYRVVISSACGATTSQGARLNIIPISINPNPNKGEFDIAIYQQDRQKIQRMVESIFIYDNQGAKVYEAKRTASTSSFHCNLSLAATGIYHVVMLDATGELISDVPVYINHE